jgi:photosystem II stability/assembly factor-like uncharacterized protein
LKKVILILGIALAQQFAMAQWDSIYGPLPYGNEFKGMSFVNDSTGYVTIHGGENNEENFYVSNSILKTSDYGVSWDTLLYIQWDCPCPADSFYSFEDIYFLNEDIGWVSTDEAAFSLLSDILKTTDGGQSWQQYPTGVESLLQIKFLNDSYGIGTSPYNEGAETFDGGETWTPFQELAGYQVSILDECNKTSVDGGSISKQNECLWDTEEFPTLNESPERNGRAMHVWNQDTYILGAMGSFGFNNFTSILSTIDGGETYSILDFPFGSGTSRFEFVNDSVGYVSIGSSSSFYESVYKTLDSGITWFGQITPLNGFGDYSGFSDIECLNENLCYAMNSKYIYKTNNGGGELGTMWTAINERDMADINVQMYPNPVNDQLNIISKNNISLVQLTNSLGKNIFLSNDKSASNSKTLEVSSLASGIYFISVQTEFGTTVQRFVKQ